MTALVGLLAGAGGAFLFLSSSAAPASAGGMNRAEIETIVREYILTHPEILPEAMQNLEKKQAADAVGKNRPGIEKAFGGAWEGAADGDVTLVQFFDYACGYCQASRPDLDRLLAEDKKLRVVYRELPILGPPSEDATRASLAVAKLGRNYGDFHRALYAAGRPSQGAINAALAKVQLGPKDVSATASSPEVADEIAANMELQRSLRITGTPSYVVGEQLAVGAVGYDELKDMIAKARAGK